MTAHIFDPKPLISPEQAAADRAAFLEISRQYRPKREPQAKPKERTGPTLAERRETTRINLKEAERLRAEGVTDHAISAGLGISRSTIRRYLGPPPHRKGVEHPERKNLEPQARHLRGQGWSYRRIGREIGVHHWTVQTWVEGAGA